MLVGDSDVGHGGCSDDDRDGVCDGVTRMRCVQDAVKTITSRLKSSGNMAYWLKVRTEIKQFTDRLQSLEFLYEYRNVYD